MATMLQTFLGLLSVALFILVARSIIRAFLDPQRALPGPILARFTRLWKLYSFWQGDFHHKNIKLHEKYG
jgi:hypothetical protein